MIAESEDLSAHGVFVRTDHLMSVGAVVALEITLPDGNALKVSSRVAHVLSVAPARALGRRPGMGFAFLEHEGEGRERIFAHLKQLNELVKTPSVVPRCRVVVADHSVPLLGRVAISLRSAGFEVFPVSHGGEAYAECDDSLPDVLLCDLDLPVMDGWTLMRQLSHKPELARISVVVMSEDASDMTRLQAFRAGVRDFIPKPFTDEELAIRLRRVALNAHATVRSVLRGEVAEISIGTLLSLLQFERKSGIVVLTRDRQTARLFVSEGRIVRIEGGLHDTGSGRERLLQLLDWNTGEFEFSPCEVVGMDEVGVRTDQLLIEHARIRDEGGRHSG